MEITLEYIPDSPVQYTFRVAFHSSQQRHLMPYPCATGLVFINSQDEQFNGWDTRSLAITPLDDFVLYQDARISFDLYATINGIGLGNGFIIDLPPDRYTVEYRYHVERDTEWYDFLKKRSRFVDITPLWQGTVVSNAVSFDFNGTADNAK